jgi:S1/P1 Nuclease
MIHKTSPLRALIGSCLLGITTAMAWNSPAHMAVAGIAYDELTPAQQSALMKIIRQHPDLSPITDGVKGTPLDDKQLFMALATWPDLIKSRASYTDADRSDVYEEKSPAVTSVKFDRLRHKGWHFIDQPIWEGHDPKTPPAALPTIPPANAVNVVQVLIKQLQSNEDDAAKAYDLGWLFHLVGDLHQPLHAVTGVYPELPEGDHGGNLVTFSKVQKMPELHGLWDGILGENEMGKSGPDRYPTVEEEEKLAAKILTDLKPVRIPDSKNRDSLDPMVWSTESKQLAIEDVYRPLRLTPYQDSQSKPKILTQISEEYKKHARELAAKQVKLAGHRLALTLKSILK